MHQVTLLNSHGRRCIIDFDELKLDDGTKARDYPEPSVLYRKLRAMRVEGIAVDQGTYSLLIALGRHRATSVPAPLVHKRQPSTGDAA
jgi:hypothetical protein